MAILDFDKAYELLMQAAKAHDEKMVLPLGDARGYVLAEDLRARRDLPPYDNSALDGYAIKYADEGKKLRIVSPTIFAGVVVEPCLKDGECYKIMTGAKIPSDADTIVRLEDCEADDEYVQIPPKVKKSDGFRARGEECKEGALLIEAGTRLDVSHIALLASQGFGEVCVKTKPRVCVLSSGNELREPGESASSDELYNINSYAMQSLLAQFGFESDYGGIIPDDYDTTVKFFGELKGYDALITSGGVSVGEADFTTKALEQNGFDALFTKVNLKPGKPTTCGTMGRTLVMSMPGNPLSAIINAFLFVIPALRKMEGENKYAHKAQKVPNALPFKLKDARANVVLGTLDEGKFSVTDSGKISSGQVLPLSRSNAISIIMSGKSEVEEGEILEVFRLY
jgi:molybdopterin molybdotransferase